MSRAVKIFGDASQGSLFFEGSPHPPAPLGGVVVAAREGAQIESRLLEVISSRRMVLIQGFSLRECVSLVRNKDDQRLVQDLGYTQQQVIDYINDEANRKANENDFQKDGVQVGSANTVNFTGAGVSAVSVSGGTYVGTVTIAGGGNPVASGIVTVVL